MHKFASPVPRACFFQPPCPHTADLLTAFPPCCLFSFDPIPFIFGPLRDSVLFRSELVLSFYYFSFFPVLIFLALSFCLPSSILHACWFTHLLPPSPVFHFFFTFQQAHRPFISLLLLSPAPQGLFISSCHL